MLIVRRAMLSWPSSRSCLVAICPANKSATSDIRRRQTRVGKTFFFRLKHPKDLSPGRLFIIRQHFAEVTRQTPHPFASSLPSVSCRPTITNLLASKLPRRPRGLWTSSTGRRMGPCTQNSDGDKLDRLPLRADLSHFRAHRFAVRLPPQFAHLTSDLYFW